MSFVTWAALAIGVLVAVPLVAHLLRRRPPREQRFAAVMLVPQSPAVAQRRTALEDRALLSVRALAVLGLALLGASPFMRCARLSLARQSGASIALALVIDDSQSMRAGASGDTRSRFEVALEGARELVGGLAEGDSVAVVLAGRPARIALASTTNVAAVGRVLDRLELSDRATDLQGALHLARELLVDLRHIDKRVVLLSDLADASGSDEPLDAGEGVVTWAPMPELAGALGDCAVIDADRVGARVVARVACAGPAPAAAPGGAAPQAPGKRGVRVRHGELVLVEDTVDTAAGVRDVSLRLPEPLDALREARLRVELQPGDAIAVNDAAPVVAVGGQLVVGVVSDTASTRVATGGPPPVEQAFDALQLGVQVQPLATMPEHEAALSSIGLLIVDDEPGFTPEARRTLTSWVKGGGVMLITLGPRAAAAPLGASFAPLLPGLVRWSTSPVPGVAADRDRFFGPTAPLLADLGPRGRAQLDLQQEQVEVLTSWADGAPLLLENRLGRGVAYVLTLPLTTEQSDLALRPSFLWMLRRLVTTARSLGGVARTEVGAVWSFEGFSEVVVQHLAEGRPPRAVEVAGEGQARRATPTLLGLYELQLDGKAVYRVAASHEQEVDLRPRPVVTPDDPEALGGAVSTVDVSPYVALGLLALMLAELTMRLLARRRDRGSSGPSSSRPSAPSIPPARAA